MRDFNIPGSTLHTQEEKRQLLLSTGDTGNRFCRPAAGFVRISELFRISPQTYLIAASISDDGREIRREKSLPPRAGAARTTELAVRKTLFSLFNQVSLIDSGKKDYSVACCGGAGDSPAQDRPAACPTFTAPRSRS